MWHASLNRLLFQTSLVCLSSKGNSPPNADTFSRGVLHTLALFSSASPSNYLGRRLTARDSEMNSSHCDIGNLFGDVSFIFATLLFMCCIPFATAQTLANTAIPTSPWRDSYFRPRSCIPFFLVMMNCSAKNVASLFVSNCWLSQHKLHAHNHLNPTLRAHTVGHGPGTFVKADAYSDPISPSIRQASFPRISCSAFVFEMFSPEVVFSFPMSDLMHCQQILGFVAFVSFVLCVLFFLVLIPRFCSHHVALDLFKSACCQTVYTSVISSRNACLKNTASFRSLTHLLTSSGLCNHFSFILTSCCQHQAETFEGTNVDDCSTMRTSCSREHSSERASSPFIYRVATHMRIIHVALSALLESINGLTVITGLCLLFSPVSNAMLCERSSLATDRHELSAASLPSGLVFFAGGAGASHVTLAL